MPGSELCRYVVVGNLGGGKTTLSLNLGQVLNIPVYELASLLWEADLVPTQPEEFEKQHAALLEKEKWIIDGIGPIESIEKRFEVADVIIVIDHPLWRHIFWFLKREVPVFFKALIEEGKARVKLLWRNTQILFHIYSHFRPRILACMEAQRSEKPVFHLCSPKEIKGFLQKVQMKQSSRAE